MHKKDRLFPNLVDKNEYNFSGAKNAGDWEAYLAWQHKPSAVRTKLVNMQLLDKGINGGSFSRNVEGAHDVGLVVVNASESFSGHWKDREIIEWEPHKVLEGAALLAGALGTKDCCIVVHGMFQQGYNILQQARNHAYAQGLIGPQSSLRVRVSVRLSNGTLSCAQDKALLRHLEGARATPTGPLTVYGKQAFVVNVETVASLAPLMKKELAWLQARGCQNAWGTKVFSISGAVRNPTVFEEEYGAGLLPVVEKYAGGPLHDWSEVLCVFPDGFFSQPLTVRMCEKHTLDPLSAQRVGVTCHTGSIVVVEKKSSMLEIIKNVLSRYHQESCGLCLGCREGFSNVARRMTEREGAPEAYEKQMQAIAKTAECPYGSLGTQSFLGALRQKWVVV